MTELMLHPVKGYPVTAGGTVLYLSAWKTAGTCVIRERCTAAGSAGVTASFPKGTRLTMEGKLAPTENAALVTAALAKRLHDGTQEDVTVEGIVFPQARLCGYTVSAGQQETELILVFYTAQPPVEVTDDVS